MKKTNQDNVFLNYEGDNWYKRNRKSLKTDNDLPMYLLDIYNIKPQKVLEIGASNGYRLAEIHKKYGSEVHGVEPSLQALNEGMNLFPGIKFKNTTAEKMKYKKDYFDLIILYSVLHWIDRETLLLSISNIDRYLRWDGHIIIGDFQVPYPIKRRYHHIEKQNIYTYKIDYKNIFISTGKYKSISDISINHDVKSFTSNTNIHNYFRVSLLKKEDMYLEI